MKRSVIKIFALFTATMTAGSVSAQGGIDHQIEVKRRYIPEIGAAEKLDRIPVMVDTVTLRPDVDYSITPTPWKGVFNTEPIKPIRISVAPLRTRQPFFLRLAAGLPLRSLADFYATANTSGDVALGVYANHYGQWSGIRNDLGNTENAAATHTVAGIFLEKRFARRTLSVDISDTYRSYKAFGGFNMPDLAGGFASNAKIGYNDFHAAVLFGDTFLDLLRFNFRIGVSAGSFTDRMKNGQNDFGALCDLGWKVRRGNLMAGFKFGLISGTGPASKYGDWRLSVSPKYVVNIKELSIGVGFDLVYNDHMKSGNLHIFPQAELIYGRFSGFKPYVRVTGQLEDGSFRSLSYANPYMRAGVGQQSAWLRNPSHYESRIGAHGFIAQAVSYDLYFNTALWRNYNFFVNDFRGVSEGVFDASRFIAMTNENVAVVGLGGALSADIVRGLTLGVGLKVNGTLQLPLHNARWYDGRNGSVKAGLGIPRFEFDATIKYAYRDKLYLALGVEIAGRREFSAVWEDYFTSTSVLKVANNVLETAVNLKFDAECKISSFLSAFLKCDNLLNRRIYKYNYYPLPGASVMLGVKVEF